MQIYLIQAEIVPLFTWTKGFVSIKQKNCKHSIYLNTVFSFTNNVILQTLKWYLVQIMKSLSIYNTLHSVFVPLLLNCPLIHKILSVGVSNFFGCDRCIVMLNQRNYHFSRGRVSTSDLHPLCLTILLDNRYFQQNLSLT